MARYQVMVNRPGRPPRLFRVRARDERAAFQTARSRLLAGSEDPEDCLIVVRRRAGLRFRTSVLAGSRYGGRGGGRDCGWDDGRDGGWDGGWDDGWDDGGLAGVREPRRPRPGPPSLRRTAD